LFTGLLAIVSIGQGIALYRADQTARISADAALKSAGIAERSLIEIERPWLFLEGANVRRRFPGKPNGWAMLLHWRNVGRSPAIIDSCDFELVSKKIAPVVPDYSRCKDHFQMKRTVPSGEYAITTESGPDESSLDEIQFIIYGRLKYAGISGRGYTSGFGLEISIYEESSITFGGDAYNYYE
jgi:hypothetical protein